MVDEMWNIQRNTLFLAHLKKKVGYYYEDSIVDLKLVKRQKLYGFNNNKFCPEKIIINESIVRKFSLIVASGDDWFCRSICIDKW